MLLPIIVILEVKLVLSLQTFQITTIVSEMFPGSNTPQLVLVSDQTGGALLAMILTALFSKGS